MIVAGSEISTSCFYYSPNISYTPAYMPTIRDIGFAYFTYSGGITDLTTGDYEYTFTTYAKSPTISLISYTYCAVINGIQQELPPYIDSTYKYSLGTSYSSLFKTMYGIIPDKVKMKFFDVTLAIMSYWKSRDSVIISTTWYTKKISFVINEKAEFIGVYLFNISNPGSFVGTVNNFSKIIIPPISSFYQKTQDSLDDSGIISGYVTCTGDTLSSAELTVGTEMITGKSSRIATKSVSVGDSTIYVICIIRYEDSSIGTTKYYRYESHCIASLTSSSWSTTKPSI